jgi:cyclic beta-1,2-glucan synthetase
VHREGQLEPAAEWLLDNFHTVDADVVEIHRHLPRKYYRELPKLDTRETNDITRVEAMAGELIQLSDSRLDMERLQRFLTTFQTLAPLTIGELWAWPTMLRVRLVESIRNLAEEILERREALLEADRTFTLFEAAPDADTLPPLPEQPSCAYTARLLQRLREHGPKTSQIRAVLEERLATCHLTAEEAVRAEHQSQAVRQVSMGHAITSLRFCSAIDWSDVFERQSVIEQSLHRDPAGIYAKMDFPSRDRYRHAIEELAGPTAEEQVKVALRTVESARESTEKVPVDDRAAHIGYHLIGNGRVDLEAAVGFRPSVARSLRRFGFRHATEFYLGSIIALTLLSVALVAMVVPGIEWKLVAALLALIPASQFAIGLVQALAVELAPPRRLPRVELKAGVPPEARTMVIVPALLTSIDGVQSLFDHIEVQALANSDPNIHFAVLGDYADADAEELPGDGEILAAATAAVERLNERHAQGKNDRFYLFHRVRRWNPSEDVWMGWERKRGKIEEFNRLLRGARDTSFAHQIGDLAVLPSVRYCITLDADTRLPRDSAKQLIGVLMHPLNRPRYDPIRGRVVEGYGVLQPRVSVTMSSAASSPFSRLYSGHTGVDPYTTAISDTYQDLFAEGFHGKGLYDADAFSAAQNVSRERAVSHDLFGLYARVAPYRTSRSDDYPMSVPAHAKSA